MNRVDFEFSRGGKTARIKEKLALHLQKAGKGVIKTGGYLTRDMAAMPLLPDSPTGQQPVASAAAQELAAEHGIDLATVQGTGANGSITVADVKKALNEKK